MKREELVSLAKAAVPAALSVFQMVTDALPTIILWASGLYAVLHLYVFIRDHLIRFRRLPEDDVL